MDGPPPGWYLEDAQGRRGRYWDGSAWSDHVVDIPHGATLPPIIEPATEPVDEPVGPGAEPATESIDDPVALTTEPLDDTDDEPFEPIEWEDLPHDHVDEVAPEPTIPEEEPAPLARSAWSVPVAVVVPVLAVVAATAAFIGAAMSDPPPAPTPVTVATTAPTTTTSTSTTTTTTTTTTPLAPATMVDLPGSAPATTGEFVVLIPTWDIRWSYDCTATPDAAAGGFTLRVVFGDPARSPETVMQTTLPKAAGVVERNDGPSTFRLQVDSGCRWEVAAVTAPKLTPS